MGKAQQLPKKLVALLTSVAAIPVVAGLIYLGSIALETCSDRELLVEVSPSGTHKLVIFERKCSGTEAWTTHVSLVGSTGVLSDGPGNLYIGHERHGPTGAPEVSAKWDSAARVVLRAGFPPEHRGASELAGVQIVHSYAQ